MYNEACPEELSVLKPRFHIKAGIRGRDMRVEYLNPFVESAYSLFQEVLRVQVRRKHSYMQTYLLPQLGVAAFIDLSGDIAGRVLLDMSEETAILVASTMLQNLDMEAIVLLDQLGRASITELANMITGQAITKLHDFGFSFELTPPKMFINRETTINPLNVPTLIVPMELPMGRIEINLAIEGEQ